MNKKLFNLKNKELTKENQELFFNLCGVMDKFKITSLYSDIFKH